MRIASALVCALVAVSGVACGADEAAFAKAEFTFDFDVFSVAVGADEAIYVSGSDRLQKLPSGGSAAVDLPISKTGSVAVDGAGNLFLATAFSTHVYRLDNGADAPTELPFPQLLFPSGVGVDGDGAVIVADQDAARGRVRELAVGASTPTELPFGDLFGGPKALAVGRDGTVYVLEFSGAIRKLTAGAESPTELMPQSGNPFQFPMGLAVDDDGSLYIADGLITPKVFKLTAGTTEPKELDVGELSDVKSLAVGHDGDLYVATKRTVMRFSVAEG